MMLSSFFDVSDRLQKVLITETEENTIPYKTIGQYLNAGKSAKKEFMKIPNLGRQTVEELDELIRKSKKIYYDQISVIDIPEDKAKQNTANIANHIRKNIIHTSKIFAGEYDRQSDKRI